VQLCLHRQRQGCSASTPPPPSPATQPGHSQGGVHCLPGHQGRSRGPMARASLPSKHGLGSSHLKMVQCSAHIPSRPSAERYDGPATGRMSISGIMCSSKLALCHGQRLRERMCITADGPLNPVPAVPVSVGPAKVVSPPRQRQQCTPMNASGCAIVRSCRYICGWA
jgi:hypothetical protein